MKCLCKNIGTIEYAMFKERGNLNFILTSVHFSPLTKKIYFGSEEKSREISQEFSAIFPS